MQPLFNTIALLALFSLMQCQPAERSWQLEAPNSAYSVTVRLDENGRLAYQVEGAKALGQPTLIHPSRLGLERADADFTQGLSFAGANTEGPKQESYALVSGPSLTPEHRYLEQSLQFKNEQGQPIEIVLRAYDEGLALRYVFLGQSDTAKTVTKELTEFLIKEGQCWAHPYDTVTKWNPAYETYFEGPMPVGTAAPANKNGWAFPMLFETQGHWLLLSEAGFDGTYGGSHIQGQCEGGAYRTTFAVPEEAYGLHSAYPSAKLPWATPWRFVLINTALEQLAASQLVTALAPPNRLEETRWIQPGRSTWSWWAYSDSPQDYQQLVPYIDFAAEMGWAYSLVDANWNKMKNGNLEKLAEYAEQQGVGLLVWYNSGGPHNTVEEAPRDRMHIRERRRATFKRLQQLGIKGIKVDFFQSDKQAIIQQYIGILEDAADYELVVNFHGCTLPKGWRRTYPNLLTMEAVRGGECYKFDASYPERAPAHLAILPFTRGVVGPTDYTPGGFSDNTYPHRTTYGFELALPLVLESGLIHYTDTPEKIRSLPGFAMQWLKDLPAAWDETKILGGYPGQYAVVARRKGPQWFIGGINGQVTPKTLELRLDQLTGPSGGSLNLILDEGKNGEKLVEKRINIDKREVRVVLPPYGGMAGVLTTGP